MKDVSAYISTGIHFRLKRGFKLLGQPYGGTARYRRFLSKRSVALPISKWSYLPTAGRETP
jgi:hypothetical protein